MVIIGIVYAVMNVDAEDATGSLVLAIAVGGLAAGESGVLNEIPVLGEGLHAAFGALAMALWAGVATVAATRLFNRIKG